MWTAEPRVVGEARLLWRQYVGAVHLRQVLRQHDAAFQLLGTRVSTLAEIDNGALLPPAVPGTDNGLELLVDDEGRGSGTAAAQRTVFGLEGQYVVGGGELEVVAVALLQGSIALPADGQIIAGGVNDMLDDGAVGVGSAVGKTVGRSDDAGGVALRLRPVGGIVGMLASGVGETDGNTGAAVLQQWCLDAVDDGILVLQGGGGDVDGRPVGRKVRLNLAVVKL